MPWNVSLLLLWMFFLGRQDASPPVIVVPGTGTVVGTLLFETTAREMTKQPTWRAEARGREEEGEMRMRMSERKRERSVNQIDDTHQL